jgi:hypothetical protein
MITIKTYQVKNKKNWRPRVFTFLTALLSIVLLVAGTFEFIPAWILKDPAESIHLWHIAELAALAGILLGGVMLGLIRRPQEKPLLAQYVVLSATILAVGIMPFDIKAVVLLLLAGLFVLSYPQPRALLNFSRKGRMSAALLVITVLFAVILDPIIQQEIHYQMIGMTENDVHALDLHWIGSALLMVLLILAGVLASTKRPGWKWLGIITGLTYGFLGVIAMIVPGYAAGAWSEAGGLFAVFFGALYILITLAEAEGMRQSVSTSVHEPEFTSEVAPVIGTVTTSASEPAFAPEALAAYKTKASMKMSELEPVGMGRK